MVGIASTIIFQKIIWEYRSSYGQDLPIRKEINSAVLVRTNESSAPPIASLTPTPATGVPPPQTITTISDLWGLKFGYVFPPMVQEYTGEGYDFYPPGKRDNALFYANRITNFTRKTDGIADYAMSQAIKDDLMTARNPCDVLQNIDDKKYDNGELSLPLTRVGPMLCKSQKVKDMTVLSAVGFGWQFESLPNISSMLIVIRKSDVVMLGYVGIAEKLPVISQSLEKMTKDFMVAHPQSDFPSDEFNELNTKMVSKITKAITNHDPELVNLQNYLYQIGQTVQ